MVSSVLTVLYYAVMIVAAWKLFQIVTELGEIKVILGDIRRYSVNPASKSAAQITPAEPISLESAEALLREVAAESPVAPETSRPNV